MRKLGRKRPMQASLWLFAIGYWLFPLPRCLGTQTVNSQSPMANLAVRLRAVRAASLASPWRNIGSRRRISRAATNCRLRRRPRRGPSTSSTWMWRCSPPASDLGSWLVYKPRSRKGLVALSVFSLLYFGFWRKGCVCAIGSLQNVALGLLRPGLRGSALSDCLFPAPLAFALFGGRTFLRRRLSARRDAGFGAAQAGEGAALAGTGPERFASSTWGRACCSPPPAAHSSSAI